MFFLGLGLAPFVDENTFSGINNLSISSFRNLPKDLFSRIFSPTLIIHFT